VPDKQTAFGEYKESRGKEIVDQIERDRDLLKDKKDKIKQISSFCQELKADIESVTTELQIMKARDEDRDVIEGE